MHAGAQPRCRVRGLYRENIAGLAHDYAQLKRRLFELSLASIRNTQAIDDLMRRLQPTAPAANQQI